MTRQERIEFIVEAIYSVEGVRVDAGEFERRSDEQLEEDVEWYEYLLTK